MREELVICDRASTAAIDNRDAAALTHNNPTHPALCKSTLLYQMVDKLGNLSDKAVDRIAMLLRVVMAIIKCVRRCWAFVRGQQGLALGVVLLLVAIVLRWLGRL